MSISVAVLWAVALSGATLAAWAMFIVLIPNCLCSLFRYRLWRLRDAVKDDILYGRLPDHEFIGEFVLMIEAFILVANKLTLIQMLLLPSDKQEAARRRKALDQSMQELGEEPRKQFSAYRKEFMAIIVKRLFVGSLTGWAFLAVMLPAILLISASRVVRRASLSATDIIISIIRYTNRCVAKWLNRDADLDWPDVAGKIVTMQVVSAPSKSLSDCAA